MAIKKAAGGTRNGKRINMEDNRFETTVRRCLRFDRAGLESELVRAPSSARRISWHVTLFDRFENEVALKRGSNGSHVIGSQSPAEL